MNNIIETNNLSCRYGSTEALRNLTFSVTEGSIFGFIGANGAGKTTTIKLLMNLLKPTGGQATLLGIDSRKLGPKELAQIGYVSENQQLPEWMTVSQLMNYCKPMYPTWDESFSKQLLTKFKLPLDRQLGKLSRGMKMKAALASSLAYRPRLLILDEPFSGLDPFVRDEFIRGMLEISEQASWSVFISSHDVDEVERLADCVGFINEGTMAFSEANESLQNRFRRMEFGVSEGVARLPDDLPSQWLRPEISGLQIRFITGQYQPLLTETVIQQYFPGASSIIASTLSLREIFIAISASL